MSINSVQLPNGSNVLFNVVGDELRIAWASPAALQLSAEDVVFNINATINNAADLVHYPFAANNESEIADDEAMAYSSITLEMPTFETVSLLV